MVLYAGVAAGTFCGTLRRRLLQLRGEWEGRAAAQVAGVVCAECVTRATVAV